jgi:hypothetical protein
MVMVLAATVKAPWLWCRSRPFSSHSVFDSLRPIDKVRPRSRFWRPRSRFWRPYGQPPAATLHMVRRALTSRPAAGGLRKRLNSCTRQPLRPWRLLRARNPGQKIDRMRHLGPRFVPRISVLVLRLRASLVVPASNGIFNRQHDERRRDQATRRCATVPSRSNRSKNSPTWKGDVRACVAPVPSSGGFRLAEVALVDGTAFTAMKMSRASLFFIINGATIRCPTPEELLSMRSGVDRVGVLACAAKNDPLVIHFLPSPIIVSFNPDDPEDPGLILRDLALHCPVRAEDLRSTPLFTYSRGGEALGYNFLRKLLKILLLTLFTTTVAALFTWHSFRSGLACALRAAKAPDWVLLALLRWRSKSSIPGYGRLSFETAASWLDQAAVQNERTLTAGSLPGLVLAPESAPNELPPSAYDFLERARAIDIDQEELQALHVGLPQYDDDEFMTELAALPDQDEAEEARVAGTW